jgi:hypothetical protein
MLRTSPRDIHENDFTHTATVCRWIARIVSALLVIELVILAVGEGIPHSVMHPGSMIAKVGFIGFALMATGMLIGWRWELTGGILSLVGVLLLLEPTRVNGRITWFFAVLAAPGVLYITSHLLRSHASRRSKTQPPARSNA